MSQEPPDARIGRGLDDADDRRPNEEEERLRFVTFALGDLEFALPADEVRTVMDPPADVTRVPRTPPTIDGITDLRGEITAVVDPRRHFPVPEEAPDDEQLLVLDRPTDRQAAGIRVDRVRDVETVPRGDVVGADDLPDEERPAPLVGHPIVGAFVRRVGSTGDEEDRGGTETGSGDPLGGIDGVRPSGSGDADPLGLEGTSPSIDLGSAADRRAAVGDTSRFDGISFGSSDDGSEESADDESDASDGATADAEVAAALIDVDLLLRASGPIGEGD